MTYLLYGAEIILLVIALVDIIARTDDQIRHLPKIAWVLIVLFVPVVGSIVWFAIGHPWDAAPRNHGRYAEPRPERFSTLAEARTDHGDRRVTATEQELADLEREIEFWEAKARLKRAKEDAGEGDPTPAA
jgi:hypothetical protein